MAMLVGVFVIVLIVKWAPSVLAPSRGAHSREQAVERGGVRTALLAIGAGAIAIWGTVYAVKGFTLNRQGQIADRFTRAVGQLGSDQVAVRVGAIYELERIACESVVDTAPIVEILTRYLRDQARPKGLHAMVRLRRAPPLRASAALRRRGMKHLRAALRLRRVQRLRAALRLRGAQRLRASAALRRRGAPHLAVDLQAALSAIAALSCLVRREGQRDEPALRLDFGGVALPHGNCQGAQVPFANFSEADLRVVDFSNSDLRRALFYGATLRWAIIVRAKLQKASLYGADLSHANLVEAELEAANLTEANLDGAHLMGANLKRVCWRGMSVRGAWYDKLTGWPKDFDPIEEGALMIDGRLPHPASWPKRAENLDRTASSG